MPFVLSLDEESALDRLRRGRRTLVSEAGIGLYTEAGVLAPSCEY